jgi:DNA-binding transcriptional ArsR family regulator
MNDLVRLFKALSDPTRLRILNALGAHTLCVGALAHRLGVTQSAVSQHLRILREAGLVQGEKRGYWVHYSLDRREVLKIKERAGKWLEGLSAAPASECTDTRRCPRKGDSRLGKSAARR